MIEYMRECPLDEKEYYQCSVCHEEKHINELSVHDWRKETLK